MTEWSPQQSAALDAVAAWLRSGDARRKPFYLAGTGGTGKSTLAIHLAKNANGHVHFAAFTGKAALVLQRKGCEGATTLHRLMYTPTSGGFKLKHREELEYLSLIVADEISMANRELGEDLLSFGIPVLVLGDPEQLPPVSGEGYFTNREPDVMLTEVHRQARENPIIRLSMDVREGRRLQLGTYGSTRIVDRKTGVGRKMVMDADQVLIGLNKSRAEKNAKMRELLGFRSMYPRAGEKLVCLRNNYAKGLLNGQTWIVVETIKCDGDLVEMTIKSEDDHTQEAHVTAPTAIFLGRPNPFDWRQMKQAEIDEFDYGYALTVHKSQGSQWPHVMLFNESYAFREPEAGRRWLYTGISRAAERLTIAL